jgi:hypothetical protein
VDERLEGLSRLVRAGGVSRFAIANPEVAPYGRAAEAVLRKHGLWDLLRPGLVLGDTIAQAAQFATTGSAAGGLLAYSLVIGAGLADRGTYAVIPDADYPPLRQRMVLLAYYGAFSREQLAEKLAIAHERRQGRTVGNQEERILRVYYECWLAYTTAAGVAAPPATAAAPVESEIDEHQPPDHRNESPERRRADDCLPGDPAAGELTERDHGRAGRTVILNGVKDLGS